MGGIGGDIAMVTEDSLGTDAGSNTYGIDAESIGEYRRQMRLINEGVAQHGRLLAALRVVSELGVGADGVG